MRAEGPGSDGTIVIFQGVGMFRPQGWVLVLFHKQSGVRPSALESVLLQDGLLGRMTESGA